MARPRGHRLDSTDLKILQELLKRPDVPLEELADAVGLSYTPCRARLLHLRKAGYVRTDVRVIETRTRWQSLHLVNVKLPDNSEELLRTFIDRVQSINYIVECDQISGFWDFCLRIATPDLAVFNKVRVSLIDGFSGAKTETTEIVRTIRYYHIPPEALFGASEFTRNTS